MISFEGIKNVEFDAVLAEERGLIIQPTSVAALTWLGAASGASSEAWRMGSVLSARMLGSTEQGSVVIQIGALTVEADVLGMQLPSQFQVRVLSVGAQPLLELIGPQTSPDNGVNQALRERLPQQNGYAPLLATVAALAQWPVLKQLPVDVRTALALLEHSMATPEDVATPEGLRKAIERSGLFLESQLAQSSSDDVDAGQGDWKGALLRLLSVLDGQTTPSKSSGTEVPPPLQSRGMTPQGRVMLPPELLETRDAADLLPRLRTDVQAALARLEVAQLEAKNLPACMIEIPLHGDDGTDVLQIRLEHHSRDPDREQHWTLGFALDLQTLGPIQGELVLRGLHLSVRLWALHSATVATLEQQFVELRGRLAASGLTLDQLSCQTGLPQSENHRSAVFLEATA
jgi:hypothetical protein